MNVQSPLERVLCRLPQSPRRAVREVQQVGGCEVVASEARRYGLFPLLAHYLPEQFVLNHGEQIGAIFGYLQLERLSIEAVSTLQASGVDAVLLKGLDIAMRLYPEPWLRPSGDIDLLVSRSALERAMHALADAGWKQITKVPRTRFEFSNEVAFVAPQGGVVELHFGQNEDFQTRLDADATIARSRVVTLAGRDVRVLAEEDDLLLQCVHVAHHRFLGVKWLFDLKLAALSQPRCWEELPELARKYRVASAVGMALREAARRMGAPVPAAVLSQLPPGPMRARAVRRACLARDHDISHLLVSLLLADRMSWGLLREAAVRPAGRVLTRVGFGAQAKQVVWKLGGWARFVRRR